MVKNPSANAEDVGSIPVFVRCPGVGNGSPPPGFLPGKSHGQRSLAGYSPVHGVAKRHDCAHTHEVRWFSFTLKFDIHCFSIADGEDKVT